MPQIVVSIHARKRLRERVGINARSVQRQAERAYQRGKRPGEFEPESARALAALADNRRSVSTDIVRVYGGYIYLFAVNPNDEEALNLVTVTPFRFRKVEETPDAEKGQRAYVRGRLVFGRGAC